MKYFVKKDKELYVVVDMIINQPVASFADESDAHKFIQSLISLPKRANPVNYLNKKFPGKMDQTNLKQPIQPQPNILPNNFSQPKPIQGQFAGFEKERIDENYIRRIVAEMQRDFLAQQVQNNVSRQEPIYIPQPVNIIQGEQSYPYLTPKEPEQFRQQPRTENQRSGYNQDEPRKKINQDQYYAGLEQNPFNKAQDPEGYGSSYNNPSSHQGKYKNFQQARPSQRPSERWNCFIEDECWEPEDQNSWFEEENKKTRPVNKQQDVKDESNYHGRDFYDDNQSGYSQRKSTQNQRPDDAYNAKQNKNYQDQGNKFNNYKNDLDDYESNFLLAQNSQWYEDKEKQQKFRENNKDVNNYQNQLQTEQFSEKKLDKEQSFKKDAIEFQKPEQNFRPKPNNYGNQFENQRNQEFQNKNNDNNSGTKSEGYYNKGVNKQKPNNYENQQNIKNNDDQFSNSSNARKNDDGNFYSIEDFNAAKEHEKNQGNESYENSYLENRDNKNPAVYNQELKEDKSTQSDHQPQSFEKTKSRLNNDNYEAQKPEQNFRPDPNNYENQLASQKDFEIQSKNAGHNLGNKPESYLNNKDRVEQKPNNYNEPQIYKTPNEEFVDGESKAQKPDSDFLPTQNQDAYKNGDNIRQNQPEANQELKPKELFDQSNQQNEETNTGLENSKEQDLRNEEKLKTSGLDDKGNDQKETTDLSSVADQTSSKLDGNQQTSNEMHDDSKQSYSNEDQTKKHGDNLNTDQKTEEDASLNTDHVESAQNEKDMSPVGNEIKTEVKPELRDENDEAQDICDTVPDIFEGLKALNDKPTEDYNFAKKQKNYDNYDEKAKEEDVKYNENFKKNLESFAASKKANKKEFEEPSTKNGLSTKETEDNKTHSQGKGFDITSESELYDDYYNTKPQPDDFDQTVEISQDEKEHKLKNSASQPLEEIFVDKKNEENSVEETKNQPDSNHKNLQLSSEIENKDTDNLQTDLSNINQEKQTSNTQPQGRFFGDPKTNESLKDASANEAALDQEIKNDLSDLVSTANLEEEANSNPKTGHPSEGDQSFSAKQQQVNDDLQALMNEANLDKSNKNQQQQNQILATQPHGEDFSGINSSSNTSKTQPNANQQQPDDLVELIKDKNGVGFSDSNEESYDSDNSSINNVESVVDNNSYNNQERMLKTNKPKENAKQNQSQQLDDDLQALMSKANLDESNKKNQPQTSSTQPHDEDFSGANNNLDTSKTQPGSHQQPVSDFADLINKENGSGLTDSNLKKHDLDSSKPNHTERVMDNNSYHEQNLLPQTEELNDNEGQTYSPSHPQLLVKRINSDVKNSANAPYKFGADNYEPDIFENQMLFGGIMKFYNNGDDDSLGEMAAFKESKKVNFEHKPQPILKREQPVVKPEIVKPQPQVVSSVTQTINPYQELLTPAPTKTKTTVFTPKSNPGNVLDLGPIEEEDDIFSTPRADKSVDEEEKLTKEELKALKKIKRAQEIRRRRR